MGCVGVPGYHSLEWMRPCLQVHRGRGTPQAPQGGHRGTDASAVHEDSNWVSPDTRASVATAPMTGAHMPVVREGTHMRVDRHGPWYCGHRTRLLMHEHENHRAVVHGRKMSRSSAHAWG